MLHKNLLIQTRLCLAVGSEKNKLIFVQSSIYKLFNVISKKIAQNLLYNFDGKKKS